MTQACQFGDLEMTAGRVNLNLSQYFDNLRNMESLDAINALGSLAQLTRLEVFRLLVRHEPDDMAAGDIARQLGVPANTLSTHLAVLARAGLVTSIRQGRSIIYRANISALGDLMLFLAKDCCGGNQALCAPLSQELACC